MEFSKSEQKYLLKLARESIQNSFQNRNLQIKESDITSKNLKDKMACFVTLMIDSQLRGCIGHLEAIQPLYLDVIENSKAAAFGDPRFPPLEENELEKIDIEISVLTPAKEFRYKNTQELIDYLQKNKPGVIIQKGLFQATYLPSVWDEIHSSEEFLSSLCLKAGLPAELWKDEKLNIQIYTAEKIS